MKLEKIITGLDCQKFGETGVEIGNIVDDSRKVTPNSLFVAIKGLNLDAHKFIPDVIKKGVEVVVGQEDYKKLKDPYPLLLCPRFKQIL